MIDGIPNRPLYFFDKMPQGRPGLSHPTPGGRECDHRTGSNKKGRTGSVGAAGVCLIWYSPVHRVFIWLVIWNHGIL